MKLNIIFYLCYNVPRMIFSSRWVSRTSVKKMLPHAGGYFRTIGLTIAGMFHSVFCKPPISATWYSTPVCSTVLLFKAIHLFNCEYSTLSVCNKLLHSKRPIIQVGRSMSDLSSVNSTTLGARTVVE
jgi:hypothetical protein